MQAALFRSINIAWHMGGRSKLRAIR